MGLGNLAVLQARMSSSRLPGKVLMPILGKPMIRWQIESILKSSLIDEFLVATSKDSSDDILCDYLRHENINFTRGNLVNLVDRFSQVILMKNPQNVIRLTADCPLISWQVMDEVIGLHLTSGVDYTSNVNPPTYPDGLDVEVFSRAAFDRLQVMPLSDYQLEHVTAGFYQQPEFFSLANLEAKENLSHYRWTVDTKEDMDFASEVIAGIDATKEGISFLNILSFLDSHPNLHRIAAR